MPYTTRADGDVVTASSHNANCRDQVISSVTSATRPAGTESQIIGETDTDLFQVYTGSGWMNFGGWGAWVAYTPTLTQSVTVTKTITYSRYMRIGRQVTFSCVLVATSAGSAGNPVSVTLPFTAAIAGPWAGSGVVYDASVTTVYPAIVALASTTFVGFTDSTAATTVGTYLGQAGTAFTLALASGDTIAFTVTYEAAS